MNTRFQSPVKFSNALIVPFPGETDKGLQYTDAGWERVVSLNLYRVQSQSRFFRGTQWAVFRFVGADTSAYGGGDVWHRQVSPWFKNELDAIKFMAEFIDAD